MIDQTFWKGKRVFVTGHTGFKGAWLSTWLSSLGAEVYGFALDPPTNPSIFALGKLEKHIANSTIGNMADTALLQSAMNACDPEIVFHLAAQPIVRTSYEMPVETFVDNVIGTAQVLNIARDMQALRSIVVITTDKCYENNEWDWGYRESDRLGGYDPYSASKACAELVTSSFRNSFFNSLSYGKTHSVGLATVRAGNVIGGGDWAKDRLVPDIIKAFERGEKVSIRNPGATRPWQHVLEPLHGYMMLAEKLYLEGPAYGEAWNFGPEDNDVRPVSWIVDCFSQLWSSAPGVAHDKNDHPHEAGYLKLDCSKAKSRLGWSPVWNLSIALEKIYQWHTKVGSEKDAYSVCLAQIAEFIKAAEACGKF